MFKSFIITSLRFILKNKLHSSINILGLSVAISSILLIGIYVQEELSFDTGWNESDKIYRITQTLVSDTVDDPFALTGFNVGPSLVNFSKHAESSTRLFNMSSRTVETKKKILTVDRIYLADTNFFSFFNYSFRYGDNCSIADTNAAYISADIAELIFGNADPVGEPLLVHNDTAYVRGVFEAPCNTHMNPNIIFAMDLISDSIQAALDSSWMGLCVNTYIKTDGNIDLLLNDTRRWNSDVILPWIKKTGTSFNIDFRYNPIADIHFNKDYQYDAETNSDLKLVYIFLLIGLFILVIAGINYMNMSVALTSSRLKEVALRKVAGAGSKQLFGQFLLESILNVALAFALSIGIAEFLLPYFNRITGFSSELFSINSIVIIAVAFVILIVIVGIVAALFPALQMSRFSPIRLFGAGKEAGRVNKLQGKVKMSFRLLHNLLIFIQFTVAVFMITGAFAVYLQIHFMKQGPLGIDLSNVIHLQIPQDTAIIHQRDTLITRILQDESIETVASSQYLPGDRHGKLMFSVIGDTLVVQKAVNLYVVDENFLPAFRIKLKEGRNFDPSIREDQMRNLIINEAAIDYFGLKNPLGAYLRSSVNDSCQVIGIVKNFNYKSLHSTVEPLMMFCNQGRPLNLLIRHKNNMEEEAIETIERSWNELDSKYIPFTELLTDRFNSQYRKDQNMLTIFAYFTVLIIILSCLGLYGLMSFISDQRKREFSIRKILGATPSDLLWHISRSFVVVIIISILFAWGLAYFAIDYWLEGFAYNIGDSYFPYLSAGLLSLFIASGTILAKSMSLIRENPAENVK